MILSVEAYYYQKLIELTENGKLDWFKNVTCDKKIQFITPFEETELEPYIEIVEYRLEFNCGKLIKKLFKKELLEENFELFYKEFYYISYHQSTGSNLIKIDLLECELRDLYEKILISIEKREREHERLAENYRKAKKRDMFKRFEKFLGIEKGE